MVNSTIRTTPIHIDDLPEPFPEKRRELFPKKHNQFIRVAKRKRAFKSWLNKYHPEAVR